MSADARQKFGVRVDYVDGADSAALDECLRKA
jgi:hypothetical protein